MRRSFTLTAVLFLLMGSTFGQSYKQLIRQADSLYKSKDYKKSNELYQQALKLEKTNSTDLYNAACSAALADDKENAANFLQLAFDNGYLNINHLKKDSDLSSLHADNRWKELVDKMQLKVDSIEANYDKPLQKELLQIFEDDQAIRLQYISATKEHGYKSPIADSLGKIMDHKDSINLIKVLKILEERGWVGKDKVGAQANLTLFLVIQHSDLKIQEKYLPLMRKAVREGNANGSSLALLEDRVALGQGKRQMYGSQIFRNAETNEFYVAPLEDPDNVDKRRTELGLAPIAEYVTKWGLIWDIEKYKQELPRYDKLLLDSLNVKSK